jgi:hypothetical protein
LKGEKMQEIETENLVKQPEEVAKLPHFEHSETKTILSPIGITKSNHEESKKRKKMADKSRRINRRKQ